MWSEEGCTVWAVDGLVNAVRGWTENVGLALEKAVRGCSANVEAEAEEGALVAACGDAGGNSKSNVRLKPVVLPGRVGRGPPGNRELASDVLAVNGVEGLKVNAELTGGPGFLGGGGGSGTDDVEGMGNVASVLSCPMLGSVHGDLGVTAGA
jgi:hypothetical protein